MIEPEEDEGPYAASASVSFSKKTIIFEDAYENKPGESVPKQSTRSVLSCVAHGGPNGGRAIFTLANAEKLVRVSGIELPIEVDVPAGHKVAFDIVYEGGEASGSENDVVATAQFIDNEDGDLGSVEDELTVVKVRLEAVYVAPENSSQNRHIYGVGEKVNFHISPVLPSIMLNVDRTDKGDHWTQYDTFTGETERSATDELIYRCPAAGGSPRITITYKNVSHAPEMQVIEPQFVLTTEATGSSSLSPGEVGMGILTTKNYIGPMNVSFQGVRFFEVPCTNVVPPIGYYATTNYTGPVSHTKAAGAGYLHTLKSGNYWTIDEAGRDLAYQNWSTGRMEWKIPIGWKRVWFDEDDTPLADKPDYERNNNITSRPLLIGNRNDMYKQIFEIENDGTSSIRKFGYKLSRSRWWFNGTVEKD